MFDRLLLRATMWARNPPSQKRVVFVLALIAFGVAIYWVERIYGWPDFLTVERVGRRGVGK